MRVYAGVQRRRRLYLRTYGSVRVDLMHGKSTGFTIGDQQMRPGDVGAEMDGASLQSQRISVGRQDSRSAVDAESCNAMVIAAGSIAPSDVDVLSRRMRPGVLDAVRKRHGAALDQRGFLHISVVLSQFRAHGGVDYDFGGCLS